MKYWLMIFVITGRLCAIAQQPDIVFHRITQSNGLSYNLVNGFLKDSKGMLWISTYNGLNKYDGAHFFTYYSGYAKNTLPSNSVHKLAEDKKGNIWGGTDNGVFCLDTKTGLFKKYNTPGDEKWPAVYNVSCDQEGKIWVTNDFCLSYFDTKTDSFKLPTFSNSFYPEGRIHKNGLAENPDGKGFWLSTKKGLQYYDKLAKKFIVNQDNGDSSLINNHNTSALCKTPYGHYWYCDNNTKTIIGFDPINRKIKYKVKADTSSRIADGATLFEDNNHILWFCNWRYELFMIDYLHGNEVKRIRHNKNDITSISGDFFWEVMQDKDGTLWFGTVAGISKCNINRSFYKVHRLPEQAFTFDNPGIECLVENPFDKTWWLVTNKNILVQYNPATTKSVLYELDKFLPNNKQKTPYHTNRLIFFKDSIFLFGYGNVWLKKGNQPFLPVNYPPPFDNFITTDAVKFDSNIIYGICANKMLRWNVKSNAMDSIVFKKPFLINGKPARLGQPRVVNNKVWTLSTNNWLVYADERELKAVRMNYQDSLEKDDGYFTNMIIDSKNDLWMSKKGDGLIYYNPSTNFSKQFKQTDGLVMDHIMAVASDNNNKIWSACFNQFSVFNPALKSFFNFTLPLSTNNNGYVNFMTSLQNGNIVANVAGDLVEFYPAKLKPPKVKDKPLVSMVSINGANVNFYVGKPLQLQPNQNSIRIKFGMLTDIVFMPYDMLYILDGAEENWTTATDNFEANYNSLQPGSYTFKVKAVAKDKSWQTDETILQIHIDTPYYKAWWFLLLLALLGIGLIVFIYRWQIAQREKVLLLKSKAQLLEKEKTMVLYENLRQQLNPHFLFNSLTSLSGLIELDQEMAGKFLEQMSGIYRYILKSGDHETVSLKEEIEFVKLYINLQQTRFTKGLQIFINIPEEFGHYKIVPVSLQNMIENAIKHNIIDPESPLVINIFIEDGFVVVQNNLQKKNKVESSNKKGLIQFETLYKYLSGKPIVIQESKTSFVIKIPLI